MTIPADIAAYDAKLEAGDRELCERLGALIARELPEAQGKVWHAHPVWFIDGNPLVGYALRKDGVYVLFWSGQSFVESGLQASGSFEAAEYVPGSLDGLDEVRFSRWLTESRRVQWNYRDIRRNRGLVKLTDF